MQQIKWFDRKFNFDFKQNIFPAILERLEGTPLRLKHKLKSISSDIQSLRQEESWSVKENIGHLTDLEELWQGRLHDILANEKYLRPWDLVNQKTFEANHNGFSAEELILDFTKVRTTTIDLLRNVKEEDIYKTALHPRLEQPMRLMDLFLFVAEHDDHHLARITELGNDFL